MVLDTVVKIAFIATPITVIVGFYFAYRQWNAVRNTRMADLILRLGQLWDSEAMAESRHKLNTLGKDIKKTFEEADKSNDIAAYTTLGRTLNYFDTVGVLVCEGFLSCSIAYDILGKAERTYYGLYESLIKTKPFDDYVPYFAKLHDLFIKEEARRSKTKQRRAS